MAAAAYIYESWSVPELKKCLVCLQNSFAEAAVFQFSEF